MPRGKLPFAEFYKWAGILHMNIGTMSLWELDCAVRGHAEANGKKPKGNGDLSEDRLGEMGIEGF